MSLRHSKIWTAIGFIGALIESGCSGDSAQNGGSGLGGGSSGTNGGMTALGGATSARGGDSASPAEGGANNTTNGSATLVIGGRAVGGSSVGATTSGGSVSVGGMSNSRTSSTRGGATTSGVTNTGGVTSGGVTSAAGVSATGGKLATGGTTATNSSSVNTSYPCDGTSAGYNAVMTKSGTTWTVVNGGAQKYTGTDTQAALTAAYNSLTAGRTTKQSILVEGDGDISATAQFAMPSYTILNWCGTLNVSGSPSGSDRSPIYARGKTDIEIPNLKMTGAPQYGIFFRETNNVQLGHIELRLTSAAGIGIRVDSGGSASTMTTFNSNLTIDYVYGTGMGSHIVETYGIDKIKINTVEGEAVGECGLLLNRSINAEVGVVTCTDCGKGTGYAAFRVANSVGRIGSDFPAGNIHVGKVYARGGGRGIFSVSGCGGLIIDQLDIANTGSTSILLQNTYNTTLAAVSGTVVGGVVQLSNDTDNTNDGTYPPSKNVALKNLTLSGGASLRQDWCAQYGANGCTATNITGGTVSMCQ